MKKILTGLILSIMALSANAQHHHGYHGGHYRGPSWGWVAPALIGGALVYSATRPVVVQQPPIVITPQQTQYVAPYAPPPGFHWETLLDANCNCYRLVLVQG
jgi:hypothetical protein